MKIFLVLFTLLTIGACAHTNHKDNTKRDVADSSISPDALMTPHEGEEAFQRAYELIANAEKYAHVTVYSWSDTGLEKALEKALQNKAEVRVVLHPDLKDIPKMKSIVPKLEEMGAEFKIAPMNMHEKFVVVDDAVVVNTSANYSNGARSRYSENFIYHELSKNNSEGIRALIGEFKKEFVILWNTSKDVFTHGEGIAPKLRDEPVDGTEASLSRDMILFSSSENFTLSENKSTSAAYKQGKYYSLKKVISNKTNEQTWVVRDALIEAINKAEKSIYVVLNHFNIRLVSDALIRAVKRGVEVKLAVDNQEYKSKPNDLEMTPQFVEDFRAMKNEEEPPVRVKYYSHEPSPNNWLLNHHKYILIDYEIPSKTVLLSGSYNLSKTAEHNQFDNLVLYRSKKYQSLYKSFYEEFLNQWSWNRVKDEPKKEILDLFFKTKNGAYPIHISEAVALSWSEVKKLRADVFKKAPGIFSGLTKNRDCLYFNPVKKEYLDCPK